MHEKQLHPIMVPAIPADLPPESLAPAPEADAVAVQHPGESWLIQFSLDEAPQDVAQQVKIHLEGGCARCRRRIELYRRSAARDATRPEAASPSPVPVQEFTAALLAAVVHAWQTFTHEARAHAESSLHRLLADYEERFGATSAWLFVRRDHQRLIASVTLHTSNRNLDLDLHGPGIVPHVARTCAGHFTNNVHEDHRYLPILPDTRCELAAPVFTLNPREHRRETLAVVNLESRWDGAFGAAQVAALQTAAGEMIPHLLVLEALERCPWHPEVHGFSLHRLLERICDAVAHSLDQPATEDTTACSIWYADWQKEEVHVQATSGYDKEYVCELTLPLAESFAGVVASGPSDHVWDVSPEKAPHFPRRDKAKGAGLRRVVAVPIPLPEEARQPHALGTLQLSFFHDRPEVVEQARRLLPPLAAQVGRLAWYYQRQRRKLAAAYLRQRLRVPPPNARHGLDVLRSVFHEVFGLDATTGHAATEDEELLHCVTTSGLEPRTHRRRWRDAPVGVEWSAGEPVIVDPRRPEDHGCTTFLAAHCGQVVRQNDVLKPDEKAVPAGFRPRDRHGEPFTLSTAERWRLLGIGIDLRRDGREERGVLGTYRLLRSSRARPFLYCDQLLLQYLAGLDETKKVFLDWRAWQKEKQKERDREVEGRRLPRADVIPAIAGFISPVAVLEAPLPQTNKLLRQLMDIFHERGIYQTQMVGRQENAPEASQRWHARSTAAEPSLKPSLKPSLEPSWAGDAAPGLTWEELFRRREVITFRNSQPALRTGVVSGIRLPLLAWTGAHVLEGILALDFRRPLDWDAATHTLLFEAVRKLTAIWSLAGPVIRPDLLQAEPRRGLENFLYFPHEYRTIRADWVELWLDYAGQRRLVGRRPGNGPSQPWAPWEPLRAETLRQGAGPAGGEPVPMPNWPIWPDQIEQLGVCQRADERAWSVPLRLGPVVVGEVRCGFVEKVAAARRDEFIRSVPGLWSRLTCGRNLFWEGPRFRQKDHGDGPGITVWEFPIQFEPIDLHTPSREAVVGHPGLIAQLN